MKYDINRIAVCGRCVNALNAYKEVAQGSYDEAGQRLRRGMRKRLENDYLPHQPDWKRRKAEFDLKHFEAKYAASLSWWLNKLTADPRNQSKLYKLMRAERRGLIHRDRPSGWGYPNKWVEVARKIRALDNYSCVLCSAQNVELHVHHLVYVSNFGTHRKQNLVTLCKKCHEQEHKREFDFGESIDGLEEAPNVEVCIEHDDDLVNQPTNMIDSAIPDEPPVIQENDNVAEVAAIIPPEASPIDVKPIDNTDHISPLGIRIPWENSIELIRLKNAIVEGENSQVIHHQIEKVKSQYNLTDEQVIGRMAGISDSYLMSILREHVKSLSVHNGRRSEDFDANQSLKANSDKFAVADVKISPDSSVTESTVGTGTLRVRPDKAVDYQSETALSSKKPNILVMALKEYWLLLALIIYIIVFTFI